VFQCGWSGCSGCGVIVRSQSERYYAQGAALASSIEKSATVQLILHNFGFSDRFTVDVEEIV
jgi:hypothetical protein